MVFVNLKRKKLIIKGDTLVRKIVAIGGGKNGRLCSDGTYDPYETAPMDKEIIRLTGKEKPNFLFIGHSVPLDGQEFYFNTMQNIYGKMYGCDCKDIKSDELNDLKKVQEKINWADIIYEGGENTLDMIKLWKDTGFDKVLKAAWENGKVMCGVSAGGNCWFEECSSDSLRIKYGPDEPLIAVECLGFVRGLFVPHCDEPGRKESVKELLKTRDTFSLSMSNCAALEIVGDEYRIIISDASNYSIEPYGLKTYWKDEKYIEEKIEISEELKKLAELLN